MTYLTQVVRQRVHRLDLFLSLSCLTTTLFGEGGGKHTSSPLFHQITAGRQQQKTTLMVCKFNLVYYQKTEAKKVEIFLGNPHFSPSKKCQNLKKKIRGVNRLIKEVESEYSVLEGSQGLSWSEKLC